RHCQNVAENLGVYPRAVGRAERAPAEAGHEYSPRIASHSIARANPGNQFLGHEFSKRGMTAQIAVARRAALDKYGDRWSDFFLGNEVVEDYVARNRIEAGEIAAARLAVKEHKQIVLTRCRAVPHGQVNGETPLLLQRIAPDLVGDSFAACYAFDFV